MAACFKSGAKDATVTKVANQILSSIPRCLGNTGSPGKNAGRSTIKLRKWAYIFQRPFLRGLFLEGLIYGVKFAFQNRLGWPYSWKEIYRFALFYFVFEGNVQV